LIPSDVSSVLDVGCGNGAFLNFLCSKCPNIRAVGVDFSRAALSQIRTEQIQKILGRVERLPFKDHSFDLVSCMDILEHLRYDLFECSIREIERVAREYILITVPYAEDLEYALVICPYCKCYFHPNLHVRSLLPDDLERIFHNFSFIWWGKTGGKSVRISYNKILFAAYRRWNGGGLLVFPYVLNADIKIKRRM